MNPNTDPALYKDTRYVAFSEKIAVLGESEAALTPQQYYDLCREALSVKQALPDLRADIAYDMVCAGARLDPAQSNNPTLKELQDSFMNLEIPDAHVDTTQASVAQQWAHIEQLLDNLQT